MNQTLIVGNKRIYTMTHGVLTRLTNSRGKPPRCQTCGQLIKVGERIVVNRKFSSIQEKDCIDMNPAQERYTSYDL